MKFKVEEMSCSHCVSTIDSILKKNKNIKNIKIDLKSKQVEFEGTIDKIIVIDTLKENGYTAEEII
jgi:copper chaperone